MNTTGRIERASWAVRIREARSHSASAHASGKDLCPTQGMRRIQGQQNSKRYQPKIAQCLEPKDSAQYVLLCGACNTSVQPSDLFTDRIGIDAQRNTTHSTIGCDLQSLICCKSICLL